MASFELEGNTLGDKHRNYNKLLKEAVTNNALDSTVADSTGDIKNLLKIDLDNRNKNVEAILKAFQSTDSLYSSQAIKRCSWLINDEKFAHIINPENVYTHLFPVMTTKAFNKLILRIRLTLKDEKRVEEFFNYEKEKNPVNAYKWLQQCSLSFIVKVVEEFGTEIHEFILKRLFTRSFTIFEAYLKDNGNVKSEVMNISKCLLNVDTEKYLDNLKSQHSYLCPRFTAKNTKLIMKKSPYKVLNNLETFLNRIHMPTLAKYIKAEDVPGFLSNYKTQRRINFKSLKLFVRHLPKEDKFKFIKAVLIERDEPNIEVNLHSIWPNALTGAYSDRDAYQWYIFAPFDEALHDLKKFIKAESNPCKRNKILSVLIDCAKQDPENNLTLLRYYRENHMKELVVFKSQFVNNLIIKTKPHTYDDITWNVLNQLFLSMDVYIESSKDVQNYVEHIILYNLVHEIKIPEIIESKFKFSTLKSHQQNLDQNEKDKVFEYLYKYMVQRLDTKKITNEDNFKETITVLEQLFSLLKDWNKELTQYTNILDKIMELIAAKEENSWDINVVRFYNFKKTWRRALFEGSIALHPCEEVCINALKHDPSLLHRYAANVERLRCDDAVSLRRVLSKLRIYWPQTLTIQWKNAYTNRLGKNSKSGHKALTKGLFAMLQTDQLLEFVKKYAPKERKKNWNDESLITLNLRKYIAINVHFARPPLAIDDILFYAKGDYMQHIIPSLVSLLQNLNIVQSRIDVPKLLDGPPIALQKLGIRFAYLKLETDEVTQLFLNLRKSSKNFTIRIVVFVATYEMLVKEKNDSICEKVFALLSTFIDNLSFEENRIIYNKLGEVENVPLFVRGRFYEKSYRFLKSLPAKVNCKSIFDKVVNDSENLMEILDSEFVENELLKGVCDTFHLKFCDVCDIVVSYLLCCRDEKTQLKRSESILHPLLEHLKSWNEVHDETRHLMCNFDNLSRSFFCRVKDILNEHGMVIPVKLFSQIYVSLSTTSEISVEENHLIITIWKLAAVMMKSFDEHKSTYSQPVVEKKKKIHPSQYEFIWNNYLQSRSLSSFAAQLIKCLKEDIAVYDTSMFYVYKMALEDLFPKLYIRCSNKLDIVKHILLESNSIPSYLLALYLCPKSGIIFEEGKYKFEEIRKMFLDHPSPVVKMHYNLLYFSKS